ncbi:hypothetical protein [Paenibacillus sp. FSL R7-0128]|uniref:hypothetical protein n=1 Tax=Paenibacillus sp. FSL R7-0128 TaxID=2954529 RepID=UPI0030FCFC75
MDLIKVGDNGQLEFDFESLEAMTSAEFVAAVKKAIPVGHSIFKSRILQNTNFISLFFLTSFNGEEGGRYAYSCAYHNYTSYPFYSVDKMTVVEIGLLQEFIKG